MQVFRSCEKAVARGICQMWSNNELLKGILSKYQYLLDDLLSINNFFQVVFICQETW